MTSIGSVDFSTGVTQKIKWPQPVQQTFLLVCIEHVLQAATVHRPNGTGLVMWSISCGPPPLPHDLWPGIDFMLGWPNIQGQLNFIFPILPCYGIKPVAWTWSPGQQCSTLASMLQQPPYFYATTATPFLCYKCYKSHPNFMLQMLKQSLHFQLHVSF